MGHTFLGHYRTYKVRGLTPEASYAGVEITIEPFVSRGLVR